MSVESPKAQMWRLPKSKSSPVELRHRKNAERRQRRKIAVGASVRMVLDRSRTMRAVKSEGNKSTEIRFIRCLRAANVAGWRRHSQAFGRPDFVWAKLKIAVFVDGCFWHGCPRCYRRPKSSQRYWDSKVVRNRARDRLVNRTLRQTGWTVIRIWECRVSEPRSVSRIRHAIAIRTHNLRLR